MTADKHLKCEWICNKLKTEMLNIKTFTIGIKMLSCDSPDSIYVM